MIQHIEPLIVYSVKAFQCDYLVHDKLFRDREDAINFANEIDPDWDYSVDDSLADYEGIWDYPVSIQLRALF